MSNRQTQHAVELFSRNYNCAQSVYAGGATGKGLSEAQRWHWPRPLARRCAAGEICGALTGALLALGESEGEAMAADPVAGRNALYERARQLTEAFREATGRFCAVNDRCALDTEAGQRAFKERGLHQNLCSNCGLRC